MDREKTTSELDQRLNQKERNGTHPREKFMYKHKKEFWAILIALLVFGLILAFIFAQMPIAGGNYPIPGYP
jgi:hypothetical protein